MSERKILKNPSFYFVKGLTTSACTSTTSYYYLLFIIFGVISTQGFHFHLVNV